MRAGVFAVSVLLAAGSARGEDEALSRLARLEAEILALREENRALKDRVQALEPGSPAPAAPAVAPVAAPPAAAASPATAPAGPQIKVGGQLRLRPEYRNALRPDPAGGTSDGFLGQRARAAVSVTLPRVQAFVEVQDARNWGTETSTLSNERNADLHQAYLRLPDLGVRGGMLTLGRQELAYGDERLLGAADWLTVGRSFDGGVARYAWTRGSIDALGALVNDRKTAARGVGDMWLTGGYGRFLRGRAGRELDLYALSLRDGAAVAGERPAPGPGESRITTVGTRARYGRPTGAQASAEVAFQLGHRGPDDHEAHALGLTAGYAFAGRLKPLLRLEWDQATGDADPQDGRSGEFNNLFPTNHALYGYADLLGWRNMNAWRVTLAVSPKAGQTLSADFHHFRLDEARGAWKDAAGDVLGQDPSGASGREIGDELDLLYRFGLRSELTCLLGYSAFFPGSFAKSVGHADTQSFVYAQVLFKF